MAKASDIIDRASTSVHSSADRSSVLAKTASPKPQFGLSAQLNVIIKIAIEMAIQRATQTAAASSAPLFAIVLRGFIETRPL